MNWMRPYVVTLFALCAVGSVNAQEKPRTERDLLGEKQLAAAKANTDVGAMKPEKLAAIEKACNAVLAGRYHDQFQVDWHQGGAGTPRT